MEFSTQQTETETEDESIVSYFYMKHETNIFWYWNNEKIILVYPPVLSVSIYIFTTARVFHLAFLSFFFFSFERI